jgi:glycosyltransferase involved in cell wall biosynthesis
MLTQVSDQIIGSERSATPTGRMKLLIAIPALNEEESIESIIRRSLDARQAIIENSPITGVEITVVSDGSTDRTVELASRYKDHINLVVFDKNRGYGAAIKEAWSRSDAEVLGFLDADGTCDPLFFTQLCNTLEKEQADVVLGSRLNPESQMPLTRRVGNVLFASMLSLFSSKRVRDTASGMRVVRRSSLPRLMPLPDGLHFTPAMSARAILSDDVKIVEIPMPYHEREGESKLKIGKDGLRFLRVIMEAAFLYRPSRPLGLVGLLCLVLASLLMIEPTLFYLQNGRLREGWIYRFLVSNLLGSAGLLLVCAAYLSRQIVNLTLHGRPTQGMDRGLLAKFFNHPLFWLVPLVLLLAGGALVLTSFFQRLSTGSIFEHWSRFIAMSFLVQVAVILLVTRAVDYVLSLISSQVAYLKGQTADEGNG